MPLRRAYYVAVVAAIAAIYFGAAKLGFTMAFVADQVTVVWPPTGLALAALLLLGYRVWPGIFVGAFLANVTTNEPVGVAAVIAFGNTSEAVVAAWLLSRVVKFRHSLTGLRDVLAFVVLAAGLSTTLSATIGVTSLCLGGVQPWQHYGFLWWVWWLGDAMGDVLVAPVLLTWTTQEWRRWKMAQVMELAAVVLAVVTVSTIVFAGRSAAIAPDHPLEYIVFPLLIWAAVRFCQPGATLATLAISVVAIWGTVHGFGPFAKGTANESLMLLQSFMGVVAVTGLVLAAATTERNAAERYRATGYTITRILTEASSLREANTRVLAVICETLGWDVGALWRVDQQAQRLRCVAFWHSPSKAVPKFEAATWQRSFSPGIGLPGRGWASGKPIWVADVVHDENFPRAPMASQEGLHGAFGFPIVLGAEVLGVMEFFSDQIREPDDDLLQVMATIGSQIGQVMERKRIESAVRESEARKTAMLESALDAVLTIDHQGMLVELNPAAERMFGYSREAMLGKQMAELIVPAHLRRKHYEGLARYLTTGEGPVLGTRIEMPALRADGTEFPVEIAITRIPLGAPPMFTAYVRDITDAKRLQEELRQRAEQLVEASRRKDEFLAMLSHELRNPLAPIRNAVEVMGRLGPADAHLQWACEIAQRQVQQMTRLVDDLLDVSQITAGKITLKKEPIDLAAIVTRAVETSRPLIDARQHQLAVSVPPLPLRLHADPTRLAQVFANLLNNAAKYTEERGRISLTAEPQETEVLVRVRDSGIGIAAEKLANIFDPFTQIDHSLDRSQGGLGVGLTVVRRLVEMHGGSVEALSGGPGQGSEFVVRLPLMAHVAAPQPTGPAIVRLHDAEAVSPCHRILVVDDNVDSADSLAMVLGLMGHDVRTAYDGHAALESAQRYRPEVVFLDIGLPGMDGYAVSRHLRAHAELKGVLIIALTGYGQPSDRQRSAEAGFDQHLVKPVDPEALRALLAGLRTAPA